EFLRSDDASLCSRWPQDAAHCSGGTGSRHTIGPCPVPDWNRVAQRVHTLALPARCRVASSCGYECRTRIQPDLEEGQLVALAAEVCRPSRSGEDPAKLNSVARRTQRARPLKLRTPSIGREHFHRAA